MPRQMPRFDRDLSVQSRLALEIVSAGEIARASSDAPVRRQWTLNKLEALYELAYLRIFVAWEECLEAIFYRSLCGYASKSGGQETLVAGLTGVVPGRHYRSLAASETAVLGGLQFKLWHNVDKVIRRCQKFIRSGKGFPAVQENVLSSNRARLAHLES